MFSKMALPLLTFMSLMAFRFVACQPAEKPDTGVDPNNIPEVLNWFHHLSENYQNYKNVFQMEIKSIAQEHDLPEYEDVESDVYHFVTKMNNVRALLVEDRKEREEAYSEIKVPLQLFMTCFLTLKEVFDELRLSFIMWKYDASDQGISDIKEDIPFEWFDSHYFTKAMLKDVEIQDFEGMVQEMYKADIFSKKLLEFAGTVYLLEEKNDLGATLAFIDTLSVSPKTIGMLQEFLEAADGGVLSSNSLALIESLRRLGEPGSPLRNLLDSKNRTALHSFYMNPYKYAVVMERHAPRYLKLLSDLCPRLAHQLPMARCCCKILTFDAWIDFLRNCGLAFNSGNIDPNYLERQLIALSAGDGHMKMLADAASGYKRCTRVSRPSDEFSGHLRSTKSPAYLGNTQ